MESCMSYNKITCDWNYALSSSWSYFTPTNLVIETIGLPHKPLTKYLHRCINELTVLNPYKTSNNRRLRSVRSFDPQLSLLCQVSDVIHTCKICGGCQIRIPRSIHSVNVAPYNLDSILYKECILSMWNTIIILFVEKALLILCFHYFITLIALY